MGIYGYLIICKEIHLTELLASVQRKYYGGAEITMFKSKKAIVSLFASLMLVFGGSSALAASVEESEPNDTISQSKFCPTGGDNVCWGIISSSTDTDYWHFVAGSNQTLLYVAQVSGTTHNLTVYDGSTGLTVFYSGIIAGGNYVYIPGLQQGHTYIIKAQASGASGYNIQIF
jgi:hypothetical protein